MTIKKYTKKPAATKRPASEKTSGTAKKSAAAKRTSKRKKTGKDWLRFLLYWGAVAACICVMIGSVVAVALSAYLVNITKEDDRYLNLTNVKYNQSSRLFHIDPATGEYVETVVLQNDTETRTWVDLEDISPYIINAYVAVEDQNFYNHKGVNVKRTIAAMINEYTPIKLFSSRQGASTITQQLVKNLVDDRAVSGLDGALRKVREIFRAFALEKNYSKDMIMEAYLNKISLSGMLAGVQAGAEVYFDKDASEVTPAEAAMIAGITKNPTQYNPFLNPENCLERRNDVLYFMFNQGYLTQEEYDEAINSDLGLAEKHTQQTSSNINSYFTDMVIDQVISDLMDEYDYTREEATHMLYNDGLRIYTTMNPDVQSAMEAEFADESGTFSQYAKEATVTDKQTGEKKIVTPQAAMVSIDYEGRVVGVVGGVGEKTSNRSLNRAVDSARPVGSTMKPIGAYALGIDYGLITYSTGMEDSYFKQIEDEETGEMKDWPRNYSGEPSNTIVPVVTALAKSLNTIAVKTVDWVGVENSYNFVKDTLHVSTLSEGDISHAPMALGAMSWGISPLEMAASYAMFGNEGKYTTPHCYTTVENAEGDVILETNVTTVQAISPETAYIMNRALKQVVTSGTAAAVGAPARMEGIGKTGTTSDDKDHWFIGLTPYYCTAGWWGYDDQIPLTVNYSKHPPTQAWKNVMTKAQAGLAHKEFPVAENVITLNYCGETGDLAGDSCPNQQQGYYTEDNLPGICLVH